MEQVRIKINGVGTAQEIAEKLHQIATAISLGHHNTPIKEKGKCEWEDITLFTTIEEND